MMNSQAVRAAGVMQPYLFPYIGYFQLIQAVDTFVAYDDVNFIKQGWINRNHILMNGRSHLFTLRVRNASSFKRINELEIGDNTDSLYKTMRQTYGKAPFFGEVEGLLKSVFQNGEKNLARFVTHAIREVCARLDIKTNILISSEIPQDPALKGEERIIALCKILKANRYVNAIGGQDLYSREHFAQEGIELKFLETLPFTYAHPAIPFVPSLSIIDIMMYNSTETIRGFLDQWKLI